MWDHRNSIVYECSEEFLNYKESKKLDECLIQSYLEGHDNVMNEH